MKISSQNQISKKELETLAEIRIAEATALMAVGHYSGAYYLGGYAVECALKAIIASTFMQDTIPDRRRVDSILVHDLKKLASLADVYTDLQDTEKTPPALQENWLLVEGWSERSRYKTANEEDARGLLLALAGEPDGVLPWLKSFW